MWCIIWGLVGGGFTLDSNWRRVGEESGVSGEGKCVMRVR